MSTGDRPVEVALETSSARPSVALRTAGQVLEEELDGASSHASDLLPALQRLCARARVAPGAISAVYVGLGPGSYTGLRVGAACALGLARGAGANLFGLPSLQALAFANLQPGECGTFLIDARQEEFYLARYQRTADDVIASLAPCVVPFARVREAALAQGRVFAELPCLAAAGLSEERERGPERFVLDLRPKASSVLELASRRMAREGAHAAQEIEPLYLRAFAAQERRRG